MRSEVDVFGARNLRRQPRSSGALSAVGGGAEYLPCRRRMCGHKGKVGKFFRYETALSRPDNVERGRMINCKPDYQSFALSS
jgi:hypothetical protein